MITTTKAFTTSDGTFCATIEDAQRRELCLLIGGDGKVANSTIDALLLEREKVVDILTTTASSLPKARKVNGGKKLRKASLGAVNPSPQNIKP